jgi:hypothetical protein
VRHDETCILKRKSKNRFLISFLFIKIIKSFSFGKKTIVVLPPFPKRGAASYLPFISYLSLTLLVLGR